MRKLTNRLMGISLLSLLLITGVAQRAQAQDVEVSYQTFYDNLSPYGQWVYDPQYGNVWVPNEGGDFRPYGSRGHWVMTDYGNTWVSEDPWGWAVYHYGRWTYDPYYGWLWIPGYEWAPAWVSWRYGGGYSGWAPMGPGVTIGMNYSYPDSWWIFVAPQYMYAPNCYSYWRGPQYNTTYIHQTVIVNNYYVDNRTHVRYNYGPRRDAIERDTHQPVQVYRVSQTNRPGAPNINGNRVSVYRPAVNRATASTARPSNVVQAPRQIGRPQPATNVAATHQAPFRQEVQRNNPNARPGNNNVREQAPVNNPGGRQPAGNTRQNAEQPGNNQQPTRNNRGDQRPQPQQNPRQEQRNEPRQQPQQPQQPPRQEQRYEPPRQQQAPPPPQPRYQPAPQQPRPAPQQAPQQRPQPAPQPAPREGGGRR